MKLNSLRVGERSTSRRSPIAHKEERLLDPTTYLGVITKDPRVYMGDHLVERVDEGYLVNGVLYRDVCRAECHYDAKRDGHAFGPVQTDEEYDEMVSAMYGMGWY